MTFKDLGLPFDIGFSVETLLKHKDATSDVDTLSLYYTRLLAYYTHFDVSKILYYGNVNWVIAKPTAKKNLIANTFSIENIGLMTLFVLCIVLLLKYSTSLSIIDVYFISIKLFFGYSLGNQAKHIHRFLFICFQFSCMLLCYIFQAKLSSLLTKSVYPYSINTVFEMIDSEYVPIIANNFPAVDSNDSYGTRLLQKGFSLDSFEVESLKDGLFALPIDWNSIIYHGLDNDLKMLGSDYLRPMTCVFVFHKDFAMLEALDEVIGIVHSGGFIVKCLMDVFPIKRKVPSKDIKVLSVQNLETPFNILFGGIVLSVFVFLGELVVYKYIRKPYPFIN